METMSLAVMPDLRVTLTAQMQLAVGANDRKFRDIANTLVATNSSLRLHVVANSGHDPTLEAPAALAETIASAVEMYE